MEELKKQIAELKKEQDEFNKKALLEIEKPMYEIERAMLSKKIMSDGAEICGRLKAVERLYFSKRCEKMDLDEAIFVLEKENNYTHGFETEGVNSQMLVRAIDMVVCKLKYGK